MSLLVIKKFPDTSTLDYNYREWNRQFIYNNVILDGNYSNIYYPNHWTPLSVKFAFGGTEYYTMDNIRYGVDDNTYLILNKDTMYESHINSESPVNSFTLNFTEQFVQEVLHAVAANSHEALLDYPEARDKNPFNFFQKLYYMDSTVTRLASGIKKLVSNSYTDGFLVTEHLHEFLAYLFKIQMSTSKEVDLISSKKRSTRYELYNRLNYAKDYMYSNFSEKIDLDTLGRISSLSPHHFLRQFKINFGMTPHKFLTNRRLQTASDMLLNSEKSITEVCQSVGFESLSSFGILFKKHCKLSPEAYRIHFSKKSIFKQ
jgi:AraC-like DNA-binding protein